MSGGVDFLVFMRALLSSSPDTIDIEGRSLWRLEEVMS